MAKSRTAAGTRAANTSSSVPASTTSAPVGPPPLRRSTRASVPPERWVPTFAPKKVTQRRVRAPKPPRAHSSSTPPVVVAAKPRGVARRRRAPKVQDLARVPAPPSAPPAPRSPLASAVAVATSPVGALMSLVAAAISSPVAILSPAAAILSGAASPTESPAASPAASPSPTTATSPAAVAASLTAMSPVAAATVSPSGSSEASITSPPPSSTALDTSFTSSDSAFFSAPSSPSSPSPATSPASTSALASTATVPGEGYINFTKSRAARILEDGRRRRDGGPLGLYASRLVYNLTAQLTACTARFRLDETVDAHGNPAPQIFPPDSGASQLVVYLQKGDTTVDIFLGRPKEVTVTFGKVGGELQMVGVATEGPAYIETEELMELGE